MALRLMYLINELQYADATQSTHRSKILNFDTHKNEIVINDYKNYDENNNGNLNEGASQNEEMKTGVPVPQKYDHYVINKYSFPKGFIAGHKIKSDNIKKDDRKMLINPTEQRKGIIGWKLSRNKPSKTAKVGNSYQLGKRSNSTKPMTGDSAEKYGTNSKKFYDSPSKNKLSLNGNQSYVVKNNTIEYENQRLLTNKKLSFLAGIVIQRISLAISQY